MKVTREFPSAEHELPKLFGGRVLGQTIITDNSPQFLTEFDDFTREYNIQHICSPHYPQSNGMAEKAVHITKKMLQQPDPL